MHALDTFPTNPTPASNPPMAFPDIGAQMTAVGHGNGNVVTVANGNETVLYAHLQPGSLNPKVLLPNATGFDLATIQQLCAKLDPR